MTGKNILAVTLTALLLVGAFAKPAVAQSPNSPETRNETIKPPFRRGSGEFVYTGFEPLASKPVTVYFHIPTKGDITEMRVLFAMHGAGGNASGSRNLWKPFAENDGFIVIAPKLLGYDDTTQNHTYQFGGAFRPWKAPEHWTFSIIEPLFDYLREHTGNRAETYDMFGHSAGGQWTHRYVLTMPDARLNIAVAANPSQWSFPLFDDGDIASSGYSVKGTPFNDDRHLRNYFARKLYVATGSHDNDPNHPQLTKNANAQKQGNHRHARAMNFFKMSKAQAARLGMPFNWRLSVVDSVAHDATGMVYGGKRWSVKNREYDDNAKRGAYYSIFHDDREKSVLLPPPRTRYDSASIKSTSILGYNVPYINETGMIKTEDNVVVINKDNINQIGYLTSGWYIVLGKLERNKSLWVLGDAQVILEDGCDMTVTAGDSWSAGINVTAGNSLTIYAQSQNTGKAGKLSATGGKGRKGIGAGRNDKDGTINMCGGTVTSNGKTSPASCGSSDTQAPTGAARRR